MDDLAERASLPFSGVRVLDFSWVIAGPASTQWLANLGAEVILIESPTHQSVHRVVDWGGLIGEMTDPFAAHGGFNSINYGKLGCLLDISTDEGRRLVHDLVEVSDIVVTAHTANVVERLGLSHPQLAAVNPEIIVLSISSFGTSGPLRSVAGYGPTSQSYVGVTKMMGYEGTEGGLGIGGFYPDYTVATQAAYLLAAALFRKRRTGRGCHIDIAMVETVLAMLPQELLDVQLNGRQPTPQGNVVPGAAPHDVYPCQGEDRWIAIAVFDANQWTAFCGAAGHPEWRADARFGDITARQANRAALDELVASWSREQDADEAVALLQSVGIPASVSATALDLISDPQLRHRGAYFGLDDPIAGERLAMSLPVVFSDVAERRTSPAPFPGRDNDYVYKTILGLSDVDYAHLEASGIIGRAPLA